MTFIILSIAGALLVGAMSPGPSFVMVARTAIARSRADGIAAAFGMGAGGALFGGLVLAGLVALLTQVAWLYLSLKIAGGLFLLNLAWKLWRGAAQPLEMRANPEQGRAQVGRSFLLGFTTQVSNPKTAVVYASILAALLPAEHPGWMYVVLPALFFLVELGWYSVVALAFSSPRPRAAYLRSKSWVDRIAGGVMAALGLRLIVEASREGA